MQRKFFNIVESGDRANIFIYGDIEDWNGKVEDIVTELFEAGQKYGKIEIHINSNGGEVYPGIAIINAIKQSSSDITIFIDGIAASIASVIALCGRPLYMSPYARIMIHNVKAGVYGDKDDLRVTIAELEALDTTLCEIISTRLKKTVEEVRAAYFDGKDHWLTAQDALVLGLIDGIAPTPALPGGREKEDAEMTADDIYKVFNNRLEEQLRQPQNKDDMNLDEIKKRTSFVNVASEDDVLRIIDGLESTAAAAAVAATQMESMKQQIAVFEAKEAKAEAEAKAKADAERVALLDAAVADERIKPAQRAQFEALLKADPDNGKAVLESLTPKKRVMNAIDKSAAAAGTPSAWEERMDTIRKKNSLP